MRRALVLFVALLVACGRAAGSEPAPVSAVTSASVAADELTHDIPELL